MKKIVAVILLGLSMLVSAFAFAQSEKTLTDYIEEANSGNGLSAAYVALAYGRGKGAEKNFIEAENWTEKAVELGYTHALYLMGVYYEEAGDMLMADKWYEKAVSQFQYEANRGDANGMYNLAICYKYGRGLSISYVTAADWLRKAYEAGNERAKDEYQSVQEFLLEEGSETDVLEKANEYYHNGQYSDALAKYIVAARQGFGSASNRIGVMYHNGEGMERNEIEAVKWFQRGVHADDGVSMCWIGYYYEHGFGGYPENKTLAYEWYEKSLEAGCEDAQNFIDGLGGNPVNLDAEEAVKLVKKANDYYEGNNDIEQNYTLAFEYYEKAARLGNAEAMFGLGRCYDNGNGVPQNYDRAIEWYQKAVELGNVDAINSIGVCYANGKGLPQDYAIAVQWFEKAAELGNPKAMFNLGLCYSKGYEVSQSDEKAFEWYEKSAELGYPMAMNKLGVCYAKGRGVEQNQEKAFEWYTRGAEQGYEVAMTNLAYCYKDGKGISRDLEKAAEWFEKAANLGWADAMYQLGMIYENGELGEPDLEKAKEWYQKAIDAGNEKAQERLITLNGMNDKQ